MKGFYKENIWRVMIAGSDTLDFLLMSQFFCSLVHNYMSHVWQKSLTKYYEMS